VLRVSECGASSNLAMGSAVLKAANTKMMRQIEQAVGGVSESAVGSGYGMTIDGDGCNSGRITDEQECKTATQALGGTYGNKWYGKSDAPGCVYANDGRNKVYFNMELNANGHNSKYQEICKASTCSTPKKGICEDKTGLHGGGKETIQIWGIWDSFTQDDCHKECAKYAATDGEGCCWYGPES